MDRSAICWLFRRWRRKREDGGEKRAPGRLFALRPGGALITSDYNRRYLTGFRSSAGAVLVTREEAYFLTDFRYIEAARRYVRGAQCLCYRRMTDTLEELAARHGLECLYIEGEAVTLAERDAWRQALPGLLFAGDSLDGWMKELRLVKEPQELSCIRQAQELTDDAFTHILEYIRPGRTEREIALELEFHLRSRGAEGLFDFIAVSGANSSLPHGEPTDKAVEPGDFVTMDFGAIVDGWHSDMTRTVAVGDPGEEQRRVYAAVLAAQEACLSVLREGLLCREGTPPPAVSSRRRATGSISAMPPATAWGADPRGAPPGSGRRGGDAPGGNGGDGGAGNLSARTLRRTH